METLKLRVFATNQLNKVIISELENLLPQLKKYVGLKVINQDGSITKKTPITYKRMQPESFNNGFASNHVTYLNFSSSSVWLKISICLNGGSYENMTAYCNYFDREIYIGEMENGTILKSIESIESIIKNCNLSTEISEQSEMAKIQKCKELKEELTKVKNSILIKVEEYELR